MSGIRLGFLAACFALVVAMAGCPQPGVLVTVSPATATVGPGQTVQLTPKSTDPEDTAFEWSSDATEAATVDLSGLVTGVAAGEATITATGSHSGKSGSATITVTEGGEGEGEGGLPPDPSDVAPELDDTVSTGLAESTEFLYTGDDRVQEGMSQGTINEDRVAILRGTVTTRDGALLAGVKVTVLDHMEFGWTLSREDGMFDLAINGGGLVTVNYAKDGFLTAQRHIEAPWQDYVWLPEVTLIPLDTQVTVIDFSEPIEVARGSVTDDARGKRQSTLMFAQATKAKMMLADGRKQGLEELSVRSTEYTVGEDGEDAMPGELPPGVAYTYAVELSVDEAKAAGAAKVLFDPPAIKYVENFIGFPAGADVPAYYYDQDLGVWVPSNDGRVVEIIDISGGMAGLDTDGDGAADDAAALDLLGVTDAEREQLASLYEPGQSLWRVEIPHFTPWDLNWPSQLPDDADNPDNDDPDNDDLDDDPCAGKGSVIEYINQVLGETVPVTGTPFNLAYRSDRTPGRLAAYTLDIPLSGASIPATVESIELEVSVAGQQYSRSFVAAPNLSHTFPWDGLDAYGRRVQGRSPVTVRVGYTYEVCYFVDGADTCTYFDVYDTLWSEWKDYLGTWDAHAQGLAGWTLDVHYAYDIVGKTLYAGDGSQRSTISLNSVITTVAGLPGVFTSGYSGDGGPATDAELSLPQDVAVAPDGSVYIADYGNRCIRRVSADGIITTIAGTGTGGYSGDGGPAIDADIDAQRLAVGPDGSLYLAEASNQRVRRISPAGIITTVAGNGEIDLEDAHSGEGGPATEAPMGATDVAVGPAGSLYAADFVHRLVRRVGPDGIMTIVAGTGVAGYSGDGGPATEAQLREPWSVDAGQDGSLYITDLASHCVRKVTPEGMITTVAGTGTAGFSGDGGPATEAQLKSPFDAAVAADGSLYIADSGNARVRVVRPDGIIVTLAGDGEGLEGDVSDIGDLGDDGPATEAQLWGVQAIGLAPDGSLYLAHMPDSRIRRVAPPQPGAVAGGFVLPSEDGGEVYYFDRTGRHTLTVHALTGETLYEFGYDADGRLSDIEDGDGNVTTIERNADGAPTAIAGPYGQRTALGLDANGHLASIANPAGEAIQCTCTTGGLLTAMGDPNGNSSAFTYDDLGRLTADENAIGAVQALARTAIPNGREVTHTSAEGRTVTHRIERLDSGETRWLTTPCCGQQIERVLDSGGTERIAHSNGSETTLVQAPDPRFGMGTPINASLTTTTPGGLSQVHETTRTATLEDPEDVLSLTELTDTINVNGNTYTMDYDAEANAITATTPEGRQTLATLDGQGRAAEYRIADLAPVAYGYNDAGQLVSVTTGTGADAREYTIAYDAGGYVSIVTDPMSGSVEASHDAAGRMTGLTLPGGREVDYAFDANGNVTAITSPEGTVHAFTYSSVDLEDACTAPDAGAASNVTNYHYDLDGRLDLITRPDGGTVAIEYDTAGRPASLTIPRGTIQGEYVEGTKDLATVTAPDGGVVSFTYDGPLLTGTASIGTINGAVDFTYDDNFRIVSESVNDGAGVSLGYDGDGLLTQAGGLALTRDAANGLVTATDLGNVTDTSTYNGFAELTAYSAEAVGAEVFATTYTRDKLGRITAKTDTVDGATNTDEYAYDDAGRLATVTLNGAPFTAYTYDANGNRATYTDAGGTVNATCDAQDRLLQYGDVTYTYTDSGELLTKTDTAAQETTTYDYDILGALRGVTLPDGTAIAYVVDGMARRIGKTIDGETVQGFLYRDLLNPVAELDGDGQVVARFVYGSKHNVPAYMEKGGAIYRIVSDHLGSPRLVIDTATGAIAQRIEYDAFGRILTDTNPGFQPFGFAGGLYDPDTGLTRFGVRDYDAETGRWTAKDPIGFAASDVNLYGYVLNNPLNWMDPWGLKCKESYWDRVKENHDMTWNYLKNDWVGWGAHKAVGVWAAGQTVNAIGGYTVLQAAHVGMWTAAPGGTAVMVAVPFVVKTVIVGAGLEIGIGIGSLINAAITPCPDPC